MFRNKHTAWLSPIETLIKPIVQASCVLLSFNVTRVSINYIVSEEMLYFELLNKLTILL